MSTIPHPTVPRPMVRSTIMPCSTRTIASTILTDRLPNTSNVASQLLTATIAFRERMWAILCITHSTTPKTRTKHLKYATPSVPNIHLLKTCVWLSTSPSPRQLQTTMFSNRQTIPTTSPFRTSTRGVCTTGPTTHAWDGTQPSPPIIIRYGRAVTYSLRSSAGTSSRTSITAPACSLRASPTTIWTRCTSEPRFNRPVVTKVRHALSAVWQQ